MFQDFALFPHMTNLENVAYGLKSLDRRAALAEARNALRRVGLSALRRNLSVGAVGRRTAARRAGARHRSRGRRVILMDEPFSGLDQRLREGVRRGTLELAEGNAGERPDRHPRPARSHGARGPDLADATGPSGPARHAARPLPPPDRCRCGAVLQPLQRNRDGGRQWARDHPVRSAAGQGIAEGGNAVVMIRPQGLLPLRAWTSRAPWRGFSMLRFLGDELQLTVLFEALDKPFSRPRAGERRHRPRGRRSGSSPIRPTFLCLQREGLDA